MDVLDAIIRDGFRWHDRSSSRLSGMRFFGWDQSLPLPRRILSWLGVVILVNVGVLWVIFIVGFLISFIESLFIIEMRILVGGGIGCVSILLCVLTSGPGLTWCTLLRFSIVSLTLLLVVLESRLIQLGQMVNSEKPGFPIFVVLDNGRPS